jgi:hypothetical protein
MEEGLQCRVTTCGQHLSVLVPEALARWLAEGVELKDVVSLAFHEGFERRQYLPVEE